MFSSGARSILVGNQAHLPRAAAARHTMGASSNAGGTACAAHASRYAGLGPRYAPRRAPPLPAPTAPHRRPAGHRSHGPGRRESPQPCPAFPGTRRPGPFRRNAHKSGLYFRTPLPIFAETRAQNTREPDTGRRRDPLPGTLSPLPKWRRKHPEKPIARD